MNSYKENDYGNYRVKVFISYVACCSET